MKTLKIQSLKLLLCFFLLSVIASGQGYGEIRGIVKDTAYIPIPFVTIKILQGNQLIAGAQTDDQGRYSIKPLNPGLYELVAMESEHNTLQIRGINVRPNAATYVDPKMKLNLLGVVDVFTTTIDYSKVGVNADMFTTVELSGKDLARTAGVSSGDIKGALELITAEVVPSNDGQVHFRGSRGEASGFFVDGHRTLNAVTVPGLAIENLSVFTGGVPACYGDITAGAVVITTKSYFSGIREKNIRINAERESREQEKALKKAKEEEEKRQKEIDDEKSKESDSK